MRGRRPLYIGIDFAEEASHEVIVFRCPCRLGFRRCGGWLLVEVLADAFGELLLSFRILLTLPLG
jgi:hypothetical protein